MDQLSDPNGQGGAYQAQDLLRWALRSGFTRGKNYSKTCKQNGDTVRLILGKASNRREIVGEEEKDLIGEIGVTLYLTL